jgi:hypothetical protein
MPLKNGYCSFSLSTSSSFGARSDIVKDNTLVVGSRV